MDEQQLQKMERDLIQRMNALEEKKRSVGTEKHRISLGFDLTMKILAAVLDILGFVTFIPFIGWFFGFMVWVVGVCIMFLAYIFAGIKPLKGNAARKSFIVRLIMYFVEFIPLVGGAPGFSVGVWYTSSVVRKEDKEYNNSIRKALKEIENEERMLRQEIQSFTNLVEENQSDEDDWINNFEIIAEERAISGQSGSEGNISNPQIHTAAFKDWFGDWKNDPNNASKIVDERGNPQRVYHGTRSDIDSFDTTKTHSNFIGKGAYFTEDPSIASDYASRRSGEEVMGARVIPAYLNIKNPLVLDFHNNRNQAEAWAKEARSNPESFTQKAIQQGHDGVVSLLHDGKKVIKHEIVAFTPNQIKSAIGNNGEFSKKEDSITS